MAEYTSLAELREALVSDDASVRSDAYGAVLEHDVEPTDILGSDVDEAAVSDLRAAGVLPEESQSGMSTPEYREKVVAQLEKIAANTGGSA